MGLGCSQEVGEIGDCQFRTTLRFVRQPRTPAAGHVMALTLADRVAVANADREGGFPPSDRVTSRSLLKNRPKAVIQDASCRENRFAGPGALVPVAPLLRGDVGSCIFSSSPPQARAQTRQRCQQCAPRFDTRSVFQPGQRLHCPALRLRPQVMTSSWALAGEWSSESSAWRIRVRSWVELSIRRRVVGAPFAPTVKRPWPWPAVAREGRRLPAWWQS